MANVHRIQGLVGSLIAALGSIGECNSE